MILPVAMALGSFVLTAGFKVFPGKEPVRSYLKW